MRYSFTFLLAATAALAYGDMAPPPSTPLKIATADAVVVGKVTALADKTIKAELYKGDSRELKVATVKVERAVMGRPGTTVKVGFVSFGATVRPRYPVAQLKKDQEALLILTKHPTQKDVYVLANYYDVQDKKGPSFKKDLEDAQRAAKLLSSPQASLKAKKAEDRLLAAALLITRYRTPPPGGGKTEPVPAAESKLLLSVLAEADWAQRGGDWQASPQNLFYRLGVTAKHGWEQPRDFRQVAPAARQWLKDNAGKFKMERYVRPRLSTEPDPEP